MKRGFSSPPPQGEVTGNTVVLSHLDNFPSSSRWTEKKLTLAAFIELCMRAFGTAGQLPYAWQAAVTGAFLIFIWCLQASTSLYILYTVYVFWFTRPNFNRPPTFRLIFILSILLKDVKKSYNHHKVLVSVFSPWCPSGSCWLGVVVQDIWRAWVWGRLACIFSKWEIKICI